MAETGASSGTRNARYGGVARFFHWSIAGLIVLQYVLAELGERADDGGERLRALALLANHKSIGMTVLALAVLRIGWRFAFTPPALPAAMPKWQRGASFASHWCLYALIFALPISGWLLSSAAAYSVSWFGVFTWPDLVEPSKALRSTMHSTHDILGKLLFVVAVLHILAALKHHFLDRDDVLRRMSSAVSYTLFVAVIAAGAVTLTRVGGASPRATIEAPVAAQAAEPAAEASTTPAADAAQDPVEPDPAATVDATESVDPVEPADVAPATAAPAPVVPDPVPEPEPEPGPAPSAPRWQVDLARSSIAFTAEQAGAPFTGQWTDWSADMSFADDALDTSRFDVAIRVAGVETRDDDRDATLQDPEFFDGTNFPEVRFLTGAIRAEGDGFVADSTLTIKGLEHPVVFTFTVETDGTRRTLKGNARLDRLALGVGTGEWADTEWVGQFVDVAVEVFAEVDAE